MNKYFKNSELIIKDAEYAFDTLKTIHFSKSRTVEEKIKDNKEIPNTEKQNGKNTKKKHNKTIRYKDYIRPAQISKISERKKTNNRSKAHANSQNGKKRSRKKIRLSKAERLDIILTFIYFYSQYYVETKHPKLSAEGKYDAWHNAYNDFVIKDTLVSFRYNRKSVAYPCLISYIEAIVDNKVKDWIRKEKKKTEGKKKYINADEEKHYKTNEIHTNKKGKYVFIEQLTEIDPHPKDNDNEDGTHFEIPDNSEPFEDRIASKAAIESIYHKIIHDALLFTHYNDKNNKRKSIPLYIRILFVISAINNLSLGEYTLEKKNYDSNNTNNYSIDDLYEKNGTEIKTYLKNAISDTISFGYKKPDWNYIFEGYDAEFKKKGFNHKVHIGNKNTAEFAYSRMNNIFINTVSESFTKN